MKNFLIVILLGYSSAAFAQDAKYEFIPCDKEQTKHRNERERVQMILINDLDTQVQVYWMNARKQQTKFADLFPDEEFPTFTYTNHYWVVEDEQGCIGIIQMNTPGEVRLSAFPELKRTE